MAYKKDTVELARRMFVKDGLSVEIIVDNLNKLEIPVSIWTVKAWKENGQWEYEKASIENGDNFTENAFRLTSFLMDEIEKQSRAGKEASKTQVETLRILTTNVTNIIKIDLERKKLAKGEDKNQGLPEEVQVLPEVQEAIRVINKALDNYNRKTKNA